MTVKGRPLDQVVSIPTGSTITSPSFKPTAAHGSPRTRPDARAPEAPAGPLIVEGLTRFAIGVGMARRADVRVRQAARCGLPSGLHHGVQYEPLARLLESFPKNRQLEIDGA